MFVKEVKVTGLPLGTANHAHGVLYALLRHRVTQYNLHTQAIGGMVLVKITDSCGLREDQPDCLAQNVLGLVLCTLPETAIDIEHLEVSLNGFTLSPVDADTQPISIGACLRPLTA